MLKKCLIKILTVLCCFAMAFSSVCIPASATVDQSEIKVTEAAERPFPDDVRVTWYRLNDLTSVEKKSDKLILRFNVNSNAYSMYLTFPEIGGFRLYSDDYSGFFEPEKLNKLTYSEAKTGTVISAGGNTKVKLRKTDGNWSLDIYNKTKLISRVSGKQLSVGFDKDGNLAKTRIENTIGSSETLTGLGQRLDQQVRNGTKSLLWNLDVYQHVHGTEVDYETDLSYTNVPILHSTNGYTLFFNSSYAIEADIGKADSEKYTLENYGNTMDFYFWTGKAEERFEGYLSLTGYNILPPKWAFSYWAGNSAKYWARANGGDYINELKNMMSAYDDMGTPINVMFVEGVIYKDPKVHSLLKKTDTKVIAWHDSGWGSSAVTSAFPGLSALETPIVKRLYNKVLGADTEHYIDFTDSRSLELIDYMQSKYLEYGTQGAMIDFADAVSVDTVFSNGKTGAEMHNLYSWYYQKTFKELYEKYWGDDYVLFSRAGYAGTQSFMTKFLGDEGETFYGLQKSLTAGLNLSLSGFSIWGSDMGGHGQGKSPSEDTYRRWMQWSAFNPLFRSHGDETRVASDFSEPAAKSFKKYYWLRENLVNAIYSSAIEGSRSASVMATPLSLAFPEQSKLAKSEGEYMFCDDILVAPITTENAISNTVLLPEDNWTDFWTGANIKGGSEIKTRASEDTISLYLKAGSVIPVELSQDLALCENMQEGRVDGLLISPATGHRDITFNKDEKTVIKYSSDRPSTGVTKITNTSGTSVRAVVAKGISASSIKVDGKALNELDEVFADGNEGYTVDHVGNTTTVWLPESWETLEITNGGGISRNLALNKDVSSVGSTKTNSIANITDENPENSWLMLKGKSDFELDLGEVKEISEIQLTWGINYANSYTVEVSEDGSDYTVAAQVTDGLGDEEVIKLDKVYKAQYIRFSDFNSAQSTFPTVADLRVYGTEMDYVGICDITGNISVSKTTEEDAFSDFEDGTYYAPDEEYYDTDKDSDEGDAEESSWLKKIVRRKLISSGLAWWIILIIIIAAVAVIAAGIVIFIIIRRKKKNAKIQQ